MPAIVKQSVQMFPRYREPYKRVVVQLENGSLHTFQTPVNFEAKVGSKIRLKKYKRNITGFISYKLL